VLQGTSVVLVVVNVNVVVENMVDVVVPGIWVVNVVVSGVV